MDFLHRTWAEIDINALLHNFNLIKEMANGSKIMAVVKANAYGHSVCDIAPCLQESGADYFAVSNIDEALQLRNCGITKPVLILGYTPAELVKQLAGNNISQCVYSLEYAKMLSENALKSKVKLNVHIKLDTGMSRLGFNCRTDLLEELDAAIVAAKLEGFLLEGIFTHFSSADRSASEEDGFTDLQYKRFADCVEKFKAEGITAPLCHCCNSAGLILDPAKHLDICRPGIILYGLSPSAAPELKCDLLPVMTLKSVVSMVKEINKGDAVSYGKTFIADKKMKIATVAAGYADGYPRLLSSKGYVLINGKKANILGKVCMDQMCIDVSNIDNVNIGDEAILFGKELPVEILADLCNTINYEIVCGISPRVPRVIIKN